MRFIFYSPVAFEKWDWRNSIEKGIGGSETSHVEMAWRLARRGHEVITYAPIPDDCPGEWRNTKWYPLETVDFSQEGVWILYRCPEAIDKFLPRKKNQQVWLLWQDWDYPTLTPKRIKAVDRHITLCKAHGRYILDRYPTVGKRLWLSSNGVKVDLVEEVEKETIQRNPLQIMHASSPDRGLKQAILVFKKAKEYVPELTLHAFYGFENLDKLIKGFPKSTIAKTAKEIKELIKTTPGVVFHGRVSQDQLYREWFASGMYLYITDFFETSNIASQEAQAMGAVPVFSPIFAQKENIQHGIGVEGASTDPLTISRAAAEVVRLATQPQLQEQIRPTMMQWARKRFNWENFVRQWEQEAEGKRKEFEKEFDFPEQLGYWYENVNTAEFFIPKLKPFEAITQEFLKDIKKKKILDVGGYDGKQAKWCLNQGAKTATVVDNSSWKIYKDWPEFEPFKGVTYINEDIFNYHTPADVVICQNVIYHVRNPWLLVEKLRNLTKEVLVISTSYIAGKDQVWKIYRPYEGHPVSWTVAWRPTIAGFLALLEANGFNVIEKISAKGHIVAKCVPVDPPIGFTYEKN